MTVLAVTSSRQRQRAANQRVLMTDLTSGTAQNIFTPFKNGSIFLALAVLIVVPFNSGTSDVITIGKALNSTAASANAYLTSTSIAAAAGTRIAATALPPYVADVGTNAIGGLQLTATWTAVGTAATAGELQVIAQYIRDGHEDFSEG